MIKTIPQQSGPITTLGNLLRNVFTRSSGIPSSKEKKARRRMEDKLSLLFSENNIGRLYSSSPYTTNARNAINTFFSPQNMNIEDFKLALDIIAETKYKPDFYNAILTEQNSDERIDLALSAGVNAFGFEFLETIPRSPERPDILEGIFRQAKSFTATDNPETLFKVSEIYQRLIYTGIHAKVPDLPLLQEIGKAYLDVYPSAAQQIDAKSTVKSIQDAKFMKDTLDEKLGLGDHFKILNDTFREVQRVKYARDKATERAKRNAQESDGKNQRSFATGIKTPAGKTLIRTFPDAPYESYKKDITDCICGIRNQQGAFIMIPGAYVKSAQEFLEIIKKNAALAPNHRDKTIWPKHLAETVKDFANGSPRPLTRTIATDMVGGISPFAKKL